MKRLSLVQLTLTHTREVRCAACNQTLPIVFVFDIPHPQMIVQTLLVTYITQFS